MKGKLNGGTPNCCTILWSGTGDCGEVRGGSRLDPAVGSYWGCGDRGLTSPPGKKGGAGRAGPGLLEEGRDMRDEEYRSDRAGVREVEEGNGGPGGEVGRRGYPPETILKFGKSRMSLRSERGSLLFVPRWSRLS